MNITFPTRRSRTGTSMQTTAPGDPWSWRRRSLPRFPAKLPGQEIGSLVKNRAVGSRTIYTVLWSDLSAVAAAH